MAQSSAFAPAAPRTQPQRNTTRSADRVHDRTPVARLQRPHAGIMTDQTGLSLDMSRVPEGHVMEWKRESIMGANDIRNQVIVRQHHWTPVPHRLQPHVYGHTCKDDEKHIVVGGLGLYMRPDYLNDDAQEEQRMLTQHQIGQQLQALRLSSKEQVGEKNTRINRQVVAVPQSIE